MSPETSCKRAICAIMMGVARRPLSAMPENSIFAKEGLDSPPSMMLGSMTNLRNRNWKVAADGVTILALNYDWVIGTS